MQAKKDSDVRRDLHTSSNSGIFGHLDRNTEDEEDKVEHRAFQPVPSSGSDPDSSGESEDSDAGPSRWKEPSSLEMDCIFLEDEKEEANLP